MIIGQDEIINLIDKYSLDTFPHSIIIEGDEGSGKHSIVDYISSKLNLEIVNLTNAELTLDYLEDMQLRVKPYVYIINGDELRVSDQNTILKFIEEPLNNSIFIIIVKNVRRLLKTIRNRCQVLKLKPYTKDILKMFVEDTNNYRILDICKTPGLVLKFKDINVIEYIQLAEKIIDKIGIASFPNTLTLCDKIGFNNEKDKLNVDLFFEVLVYIFKERFKNDSGSRYHSAYNLSRFLLNDSKAPNINKQLLFSNFLCKLWKEMRD